MTTPSLCTRIAAAAIAALLLSAPTAAQAQKCLAPDFKVELLYGVPEIEHPSVVTCDDAGNLFVGEDPMDMRGPTTKEFDRVLRIEFGPDGRPVRKTVFCENLAAVFGLIWHDGALYVMHAPHYSVFRDTDGDGVADQRERLATGFGPPAGVYGFNDHIVTGTRLGLDGRVYVSVGDKGVPKAVGSDGSTITLEGGGVVRMRLDGSELEVVTSGTRNHLDVAMDSLDNIFTYDNTDDGLGWWTRFTHHVPGAYYGYPYDYLVRPERHLPRVSEHGGGSPVGGACYREAAWPADYVDSPFFCEWGKQKVQRFKLTRRGATYEAEIEDFLVHDGSSEPFRPLDLCFSPDGRHMYLADWNFDGWVNPAVKGRLYRITYTGNDPASSAEPPRAPANASTAELIRSLGHPSHAERLKSQLALAARGDEAVRGASRLLARADAPAPAKVHAIWTGHVHAAGVTPAAAAAEQRFEPYADWISALDDPSPIVRGQAARALGMSRVTSAVAALARAVQGDSHATVRLQAAIALGRIGDPHASAAWKSVDSGQPGAIVPREGDQRMASLEAGDPAAAAPLLEALADDDAFVRHAAMQSLRVINQWQAAPEYLDRDDTALAVVLALTGVYDERAVAVLREAALRPHAAGVQAAAAAALAEVHRRAAPYEKGWWGTQPARGKPSRAKSQQWAGTSTVLATLREVLTGEAPAEARLAVVEAWREVPDPAALPLLRELAHSHDEAELPIAAVATLAARGDAESLPLLARIAGDVQCPEALRREAVRGITAIGSPAAVEQLLAIVSSDESSAELLALALEALGSLKQSAAADAVANRLDHQQPAVRAAAAEALGQIAGPPAAVRLSEMLSDPELSVRKSVMAVLGSLRHREAVPAILAASADAELTYDAQMALTAMPDRRAVALYVEGLTSQNQALRTASQEALIAIRDTIDDDILALNQRNELPAAARAPLLKVFSAPAPVMRWQLLGSFPKDPADALPQLDFAGAPDLQQTFTVGPRELKWVSVESADPTGRISPAQHLEGPNQNVWNFAYTAVEAEAAGPRQLIVGSDDQLRVWVNGEQVYDFNANRGWSADQDTITAEFRQGVNHIWLRCGNDGGPWDFSLAMSVSDPRFAFLAENIPEQLDLRSFREFAANNPGDATRGRAIFGNLEGVACIKCHAVQGTGGKVGPDLVGIGSRYPREELIRSILEPSARIANGYDTAAAITADGRVITGVLKLDSPEAVEIMTAEGKLQRIAADELDDLRRSPLSSMPNGLSDGMTLSDFADIVAFLESLKEQ